MPLLTHNAQHATLQAVTEEAVVHVGSQGTPGFLVGSSSKRAMSRMNESGSLVRMSFVCHFLIGGMFTLMLPTAAAGTVDTVLVPGITKGSGAKVTDQAGLPMQVFQTQQVVY
jgi:hypothetical protein